jgi:hypothetical protein
MATTERFYVGSRLKDYPEDGFAVPSCHSCGGDAYWLAAKSYDRAAEDLVGDMECASLGDDPLELAVVRVLVSRTAEVVSPIYAGKSSAFFEWQQDDSCEQDGRLWTPCSFRGFVNRFDSEADARAAFSSEGPLFPLCRLVRIEVMP